MNTSTYTETKSSFSFKTALSKAVPDSISGRILFWGALPGFLLLLTIGISFLCTSSFSPYLPFLALFGGLLCLRWNTIGLYSSYLALALLLITHYQEIPIEERLWQMGIIFTLAVDFFILLLAAEEIEGLVIQIAETGQVKTKELNQAHLQLQRVNQEKEELQKSLLDEIEQLKDEAEQRRIERHEENKRIELIQSEIELLTSQKEKFVAEAKKARTIIEQDRNAQQIIDSAEAKAAALEVRESQLSDELTQAQVSKQQLNEQIRQVEGSLHEVRKQAEAFQNENTQLQERLEALSQKIIGLEGEAKEKEALQARVAVLTQELSQTKEKMESQLVQAREAGLTQANKDSLLLAQLKIMSLQVSPVIKVDDKKVRELEGLLSQLRNQFDEKARVLSETRKELFQTEGKLLAIQLEQKFAENAPLSEEAAYYETEINRMAEEIAALEEEVELLEGLI